MRPWNCKHHTLSPHYAKGNGTAEAMVKVAKTLMKKNKDAYAALMAYRNTPKPDTGLSPAQTFFMRRVRTRTPISSSLLGSKVATAPPEKVAKREKRVQSNYNSHAKALKSLSAGESVRINPVNPAINKWEKRTTTKKLDSSFV